MNCGRTVELPILFYLDIGVFQAKVASSSRVSLSSISFLKAVARASYTAISSKGALVPKLAGIISTLMILMTPALAAQSEEIGKIKANFGGETIVQSTVIAKRDGKASATAYMILPGAGVSSLNLVGAYGPANQRLSIELTYMTEQPGPKTVPIDLTISYSPKGTKEHWTSEDAPTPGKITFTTLERKGQEGRAVGTFKALLCYAKGHGSGIDTKNCRPIEGSFETKFLVEK